MPNKPPGLELEDSPLIHVPSAARGVELLGEALRNIASDHDLLDSQRSMRWLLDLIDGLAATIRGNLKQDQGEVLSVPDHDLQVMAMTMQDHEIEHGFSDQVAPFGYVWRCSCGEVSGENVRYGSNPFDKRAINVAGVVHQLKAAVAAARAPIGG